MNKITDIIAFALVVPIVSVITLYLAKCMYTNWKIGRSLKSYSYHHFISKHIIEETHIRPNDIIIRSKEQVFTVSSGEVEVMKGIENLIEVESIHDECNFRCLRRVMRIKLKPEEFNQFITAYAGIYGKDPNIVGRFTENPFFIQNSKGV